MVYHSFVIQALSRLFFIVFHNHRHLLEYKFHIILIMCQILISLLIPLSILITEDVVFVPLLMCSVPYSKVLHMSSLFISTYLVPPLIVLIVYLVIYCRVIQSSATLHQPSHGHKRDVKLIRNILILLIILITTGIPILIVFIVAATTNFRSIAFFQFPVVVIPLITIIERICLIYLNQEIRKETGKLLGQLHMIHPSNQITVPAPLLTHAPCNH
jgi:hypothetical protein